MQSISKTCKTILITRPKENNQKTADFLLSKGYNTITVPLSGIKPWPIILPNNFQQFDALCATSAAAFLTIEQMNETEPKLQTLKKLPFFCVGSKTAEAAARLDFKNIVAIAKDANTLLETVKFSPYHHLLYFAGKQRRPVLELGLTLQGRHITTLDTYETFIIMPNATTIPKSVLFDIVLLYSSLGLKGLKKLNRHFTSNTKFLCLSARIAQNLAPDYQQNAIIADEPTEDSLLKLV